MWWYGLKISCSVLMNAFAFGCSGNLVQAQEPVFHSKPNSMVHLDSNALKCLVGEPIYPEDARPLLAALLSPRMVYSLLEWPRMQREAEHLGFLVVAWRDPRVPELEWQAALASPGLAGWDVPMPRALPSACWAQWAPIDHVPLTRVAFHADMHPWPIWGVMTSNAWRASLTHRLNMLKNAALAVDSNAPISSGEPSH